MEITKKIEVFNTLLTQRIHSSQRMEKSIKENRDHYTPDQYMYSVYDVIAAGCIEATNELKSVQDQFNRIFED